MAENQEVEERQNHISRLPTEILTNIFANLDTKDKGRCAQVCYGWMETCYQQSLWRDVKFSWRPRYMLNNPTLLDSLEVRNISRQVALQICEEEDGDVDLVAEAKNIAKKMPGSKITEIILSGYVSVRTGSIGDATLSLIDLVRLDLDSCWYARDSLLEIISLRFKKLTHLSLGYCYGITRRGYRNLFGSWSYRERHDNRDLPKLEYLEMTGCLKMEDSTMFCLSRSQLGLEHLHLTNATKVTDRGLIKLTNLKNLKDLSILGSTFFSTEGIDSFAADVDLQVMEIDPMLRCHMYHIEDMGDAISHLQSSGLDVLDTYDSDISEGSDYAWSDDSDDEDV